MEFHLIDSAGKNLYFPVNPEEVTIRREKGIETVSILSYGEFDFPSGEKVKEIAFSSFFPSVYDSGYCNYENIPEPHTAMNRINKMIQDKKPVRFIITGTPVNVLVLVSGHTTTLKGGEPGDIYFDLTLRTWREAKVHTKVAAKKPAAKKAAAKNGKTSRPDTKPTPKTYVVKKGDTLSKIAKRELGSSSKWRSIYNLNKKAIGNDPNIIKSGMKLVMPK
ncbi:LysM peptidoglycan-binding domain-containing protein [Paenibacillus sp. OSY-SE]|uniref:LysM peptidoglycan-binding domain-containing protein n=1 Tax=Paenibacillus sp. OSY-SE TaxID=1196323 RepID=UPI0002E04F47|nr:LysM peptidoglycan-binding domain-containing protein [Paenibacillus sp. OSY-SE]